jgi:hypothetical protein
MRLDAGAQSDPIIKALVDRLANNQSVVNVTADLTQIGSDAQTEAVVEPGAVAMCVGICLARSPVG